MHAIKIMGAVVTLAIRESLVQTGQILEFYKPDTDMFEKTLHISTQRSKFFPNLLKRFRVTKLIVIGRKINLVKFDTAQIGHCNYC